MGNDERVNTRQKKHKGWKWWIIRILIVLLGFHVVLLTVGFIYETVASKTDLKRYPPPGELVDIGGHKLHLYCTGERQGNLPTVILEAGAGNASPDWALVQPEIAKVTQVCSYDRAGWAWSEPGPAPRTSKVFATELHTLLDVAEVDAPYVLVGHSFGSHTVRIFATDYPDEVSGLVLVDSRMEELTSHPLFGATRSSGEMSIWAFLARFGFFRLIGRNMLPAPYREKLPDYPVSIMITPRYFLMSDIEDEVVSDNDVRATDGFGNTPLIVIVHEIPDTIYFGKLESDDMVEAERLFQEAAHHLATLSTNSKYVVAEGSGHLINIERPDVVIDAIMDLLEKP